MPNQAARYTEIQRLRPVGPNVGAAREPCAATNTSPYVRITTPRLVVFVGAFPKYGSFRHCYFRLYQRGVFPSMFVDIVRLGALGATRWRPWPRIFTNVAVYWGRGGAVERFSILAAEIESSGTGCLFRPEIGMPRKLQRAAGAMLSGARSRRSAYRHPRPPAIQKAYASTRSGRTVAPRANLAPRRLHLIKCVFPRPD